MKTKKTKQSNDSISDALTRMRNAILANKSETVLPKTKIILELLKVLSNYGYIGNYEINEDDNVSVVLNTEKGYRFHSLVRVSKPGVRRYVKSGEIKPVKGGRGLAIISTSRGVMSGANARKQGIGGEYLCKIW